MKKLKIYSFRDRIIFQCLLYEDCIHQSRQKAPLRNKYWKTRLFIFYIMEYEKIVKAVSRGRGEERRGRERGLCRWHDIITSYAYEY